MKILDINQLFKKKTRLIGWCSTKNLGPIGSAVLTFIGYKQTNRQTDRQAKFIYRFLNWFILIKKIAHGFLFHIHRMFSYTCFSYPAFYSMWLYLSQLSMQYHFLYLIIEMSSCFIRYLFIYCIFIRYVYCNFISLHMKANCIL